MIHAMASTHNSSQPKRGGSNWMPWQLAAILGLAIVALVAVVLGRHLNIAWDKKEEKITFDVEKAAQHAVAITQAADAEKGSMNTPSAAERIDEQFILDQLQHVITKLPTAKILWVDDTPTNNQAERLALAVLGIYCDSYSSTVEARQAIEWNAIMNHRPYDLVISDYGRAATNDSGAVTYQMVRQEPGYSTTAFVFYTADHIQDVAPIVAGDSNAAETNVRDVLLRRVLQALPKN